MSDNYEIRQLSAIDFDEVATLFNNVFKKGVHKNQLLSKYSTDYTGHNFICFGAFSESKLVSFYGSIPHYAQLGNRRFLVAQSSDAMTDQQHLRKGLFLKLAQHNFQLCKAIGAALIYGFPNQNSKPGFEKKMNWFFTSDLVARIDRVKAFPLLLSLIHI